MGSTADNWTVSGNLSVTGTTTLSGAVTLTGAQTLTGNTSLAGTLRVTGAASFYSTLYASDTVTAAGAVSVTGAATFNGMTRANSQFGVGTAAVLDDVSASTQSYTWFYVDGTNSPTQVRLRLYDIGTGAYRIGYLNSGTLVWN